MEDSIDNPSDFRAWLRDLVALYGSLDSERRTLVLDSLINESGSDQKWHLQNRLPELLYRDFVTDLPPEITEKFLSNLDCKSLLAASCVSRGWNRRIAESSSLWYGLAKDILGFSEGPLSHSRRFGYWKSMAVFGFRLRSKMRSGACFTQKSMTDILLERNAFSGNDRGKFTALHYNKGYVTMGTLGIPRKLSGSGMQSSNSESILVWSTEDSEIVYKLPAHRGVSVVRLCWPELVVYGSFDGYVRSCTISPVPESMQFNDRHSAAVLSIDSNLQLNLLVSGSSDFTVKIWKLSTGELVKTLSDFSHWVVSILLVPSSNHRLSSSSGRDLILTMTRDAIQIFDTDYSSSVGGGASGMRRLLSFREKISIPIQLPASQNYGEDPRETFFTPGFNLIGGTSVAFIRQLPMFDTQTIGDVDILVVNAETGVLVNSVHVNQKVRKLLAVGTRYALILLPYVDPRFKNLSLVDMKEQKIIGGCTVPHSNATTPDFSQITVGPTQWLDGLFSEDIVGKGSQPLLASFCINEGILHNVFWDTGI